MIKRNSLISSLLLRWSGIFLLALGGISYIWVKHEYTDFAEQRSAQIEAYHQQQRELIRTQVQGVLGQLKRENQLAHEALNKRLKERVNTAYTLVKSLYQTYHQKMSAAELESLIREALRPLRFDDGRGYLFILDHTKKFPLFPPESVLEKRSAKQVFAANGMDVVDQILELSAAQGQGFLEYTWPKPDNSSGTYKKYSYIKTFEPLGWVIGTGEYIDVYEAEVKQDAFRKIAGLRYGTNDEGYFFINSYDGALYVTNGEVFDGQTSLWGTRDRLGNLLVQESARIAQTQPEGGFNSYVWRKNSGEDAEKISFVQGMDEWQLFVGTGVYLDTLNKELAARAQAHKNKLINGLLTIGLVTLVGIVLALGLFYLLSRKLAHNFTVLRECFDHAIERREHINTDELVFDEFRELAQRANFMVDNINLQTDALRYQAHHDYLTKLPNRFFGARQLSEMMQDINTSEGESLVLLFIDLDNFKEVNDSLGHSVGDKLLQQVAERLREVMSDNDLVARLGGDEFTVISRHHELTETITATAQRVMGAFLNPFECSGHTLHVSSSIGVAVYPADGTDAETLLRNADAAMYQAKNEGKNNYRFYNASLTEQAYMRIQVSDELHAALENQEFELHYQPQIDALSGAVIGAEALLRWRHPERGLVPPDQFIPHAEANGLIVPIGEWVIRQACERIMAWQEAGLELPRIAVNISGCQLARETISSLVGRVLQDTQLDPGFLELEFTESVLMENIEVVRDDLNALKALGISLAIDDFGTGYSSLSYLKQLPIHKLKIDRSFVRDLAEDENDRAITQAVIALGKSLNLTVIAEGVEDKYQFRFLQEQGCNSIQGFLFSKPLPESEFLEYLKNQPGKLITAPATAD